MLSLHSAHTVQVGYGVWNPVCQCLGERLISITCITEIVVADCQDVAVSLQVILSKSAISKKRTEKSGGNESLNSSSPKYHVEAVDVPLN